MKNISSIYWHDGMVLMPQHFQRMEHSNQEILHSKLNIINRYMYGISEFSLNEEKLKDSILELSSFSAIFPDGSFLNSDRNSEIPKAIVLDKTHSGKTIYIALAKLAKTPNIEKNTTSTNKTSRYNIQELSIADNWDQENIIDVEVLEFKPEILFEDELSQHYEYLPLCKLVVSNYNHFEIDKTFIPSIINIVTNKDVSNAFLKIVSLVNIFTEGKLRDFINSKANTTINKSIIEYTNIKEIKDNLIRIKRLLREKQIHPFNMYNLFYDIYNNLSSYNSTEIKQELFYNHMDLNKSFNDLFEEISHLAYSESTYRYTKIPCIKKSGIWATDKLTDSILSKKDWILVISNTITPINEIASRLPNLFKASESNNIEKIIRNALDGIGITLLQNIPKDLEVIENACYFKLNKSHPEWNNIEKTGLLSIYIPNFLLDMKLEIFCI